ncbi:hypothetical protein PNOK_0592700 [Pyrrhoderma noxium]|uniref:Uncharacterized protein n=1 Tax=Pyrrhoderma noxium TaxID=2282107 RepID=A0A286UHK5_9AGAM|nr:hypothetical protein PNOK_0592700 [Pyrrhoderma noxium]
MTLSAPIITLDECRLHNSGLSCHLFPYFPIFASLVRQTRLVSTRKIPIPLVCVLCSGRVFVSVLGTYTGMLRSCRTGSGKYRLL